VQHNDEAAQLNKLDSARSSGMVIGANANADRTHENASKHDTAAGVQHFARAGAP
jgi:hypothetical protein